MIRYPSRANHGRASDDDAPHSGQLRVRMRSGRVTSLSAIGA
jgi:hypothetical protein